MRARLSGALIGAWLSIAAAYCVPSASGADMFKHRLAFEASRILIVKTISDVGDSSDSIAEFQRDRREALHVHGGNLLTFPKVADRRLAQRSVNFEGDPGTGAASI